MDLIGEIRKTIDKLNGLRYSALHKVNKAWGQRCFHSEVSGRGTFVFSFLPGREKNRVKPEQTKRQLGISKGKKIILEADPVARQGMRFAMLRERRNAHDR